MKLYAVVTFITYFEIFFFFDAGELSLDFLPYCVLVT